MTDVKRLGLDDWLGRAAALQPRTDAFIDGQFVPAASGRTFTDIGPRDGRPIAEVAEADATDVYRAVTAARASFEELLAIAETPWHGRRVLRGVRAARATAGGRRSPAGALG